MSRRSVWIFNHYASPPDRGVGTRHFDLSRPLAERGWEVTIFAAGFSHFTGREERLRRRAIRRIEAVGSVPFVWLRTVPYRGNNWRRMVNMASYAAVALIAHIDLPRPTVIVGSTVHPLAAMAAMLVARLRGARFVYEIRDLWPQTLVDMGLSPTSIVARLLYRLERWLVSSADAVVTVLPGVPSYLEGRGLPHHHVVHVPNGTRIETPPTAVPHPVVHAFDRARAAGRIVAIYAGVHGDINHLDVLVHAAKECARRGLPVETMLIGDGPEKPRLRELAARIGAEQVTFLDPVPKRDIPAVLAYADIAIFHLADTPVLRYGVSSNKLFDYLAAGRPIVFACHSGNDPVADAGSGVSIAPDDPEALADALQELASIDSAARDRMGQRGRAYVARHHDVDVLGRRFADVLDRVAG